MRAPMPIARTTTALRVLALSLFVSVAGCKCGGGDDGTPQVLMCTGTCSCDPVARTCSCSGGSTCEIGGDSRGATLECDGNASCDLTCGTDCHVVCPGTSGCTAEVGLGGSLLCQGTGACDLTCDGDCSASCEGTSSCVVSCVSDAGACALDVTCGAGRRPTDCPSGAKTCGRTCP